MVLIFSVLNRYLIVGFNLISLININKNQVYSTIWYCIMNVETCPINNNLKLHCHVCCLVQITQLGSDTKHKHGRWVSRMLAVCQAEFRINQDIRVTRWVGMSAIYWLVPICSERFGTKYFDNIWLESQTSIWCLI